MTSLRRRSRRFLLVRNFIKERLGVESTCILSGPRSRRCHSLRPVAGATRPVRLLVRPYLATVELDRHVVGLWTRCSTSSNACSTFVSIASSCPLVPVCPLLGGRIQSVTHLEGERQNDTPSPSNSGVHSVVSSHTGQSCRRGCPSNAESRSPGRIPRNCSGPASDGRPRLWGRVRLGYLGVQDHERSEHDGQHQHPGDAASAFWPTYGAVPARGRWSTVLRSGQNSQTRRSITTCYLRLSDRRFGVSRRRYDDDQRAV